MRLDSHRQRVDRLLFDLCLTHGRRADAVEAPLPARLPAGAAQAMLAAARPLYRALLRHAAAWPIPPFPVRDLVMAGAAAATPPFWVRFDGFLRAEGGIFFAEVNFDRPGGHREAVADRAAGAAFQRRFLAALRRHWQRYGPAGARGGRPARAAFLIDPAHREELHIAHFYAGLLRRLGWPCAVVGPLNLAVRDGVALAFDAPIDLLLRQFPTEFFHEVPAFADLLRLQRDGHLLIINDPCAVVPQAKTSFHWLWQQVLAGGGVLTRSEVAAVRAAVPFTAPMTAPLLPLNPASPEGPAAPTGVVLLRQPQDWVLKPVLGRYSQGVTCGALAGPDQWGAVVAAALAEPEYWIAQRFLPVRPQRLSAWHAGQPETVTGFVNWGLHLLGGRPAGWIARCSRTPITDDAWFAAVEISEEAADETLATSME